MSQNAQNAQDPQNAENTQNTQDPQNPRNVISDEQMNFTVLRAFDIIRERDERRLLKFIAIFSRFRNARGQYMFNFVNNEGNNIFMEACNYGLTNVSLRIIQTYHSLFKLGLSNFGGITALMICIAKNMNLTTFELLNYPDALPELTNNNIRFNTIDLILTKNVRDNTTISILAEVIRLFLDHNPNSQGFHRNLNEICSDQELVQRLQGILGVNEIDFSKICAPIQEAKAEAVVNPRRSTQRRSNLAEVHNISYNTRNVTQNIGREQHAEPTENDQIAFPANDMNFDANDYTPQQFERLRLRKRGPPSGGRKRHTTKKRKHKKPKSRRRHKRKKSIHHK